MTELDRRLERAVRRFADGADTDVDAVAVTERVAAQRRRTPASILGWDVPVPVPLLVALGLLVLAMAWTLAAGAPRPTRPATDEDRDRHLAALGVPLPTFLAATDGTGDEPTTARELPARTIVAAGTRFVIDIRANDPRVTGPATWDLHTDPGAAIGPLAGPMHLDAPDGAWDGECTAASGPDQRAMTGSCWLTGSGAYDGLTWFRQFTWRFDPSLATSGGVSTGIVYPAEPPAR